MLHIHGLLVAPLGACHMAQPGTDQHHDRVLRKLRSQREHLVLDHGNRLYDRVELSYRKGIETFDRISHRKRIHL